MSWREELTEEIWFSSTDREVVVCCNVAETVVKSPLVCGSCFSTPNSFGRWAEGRSLD